MLCMRGQAALLRLALGTFGQRAKEMRNEHTKASVISPSAVPVFYGNSQAR
jgi:hypothetical protein